MLASIGDKELIQFRALKNSWKMKFSRKQSILVLLEQTCKSRCIIWNNSYVTISKKFKTVVNSSIYERIYYWNIKWWNVETTVFFPRTKISFRWKGCKITQSWRKKLCLFPFATSYLSKPSFSFMTAIKTKSEIVTNLKMISSCVSRAKIWKTTF